MKIYNEDKNKILNENECDLNKGYFKEDSLFIMHHEAQEAVKEEFHYETIKEYENGGKDVKKIIDVPGSPAKEAWDEYEDIKVYVLYSEAELEERELSFLRARRNTECFPIINRGQLWYITLTQEQLTELNEWYRAWLDVTDTKIVPERPDFLDSPISDSAQEIL